MASALKTILVGDWGRPKWGVTECAAGEYVEFVVIIWVKNTGYFRDGGIYVNMSQTVETDDSIRSAVTSAVSEAEERPVPELPSLTEKLDVGALESLVSSQTEGTPEFDGSIMFEYSNSYIAIWVDSSVTVAVSETSKNSLENGRT